MPDTTSPEPTETVEQPAAAATATPPAAPTPLARRTVTLPVLPLAIVAGVLVAVLFFAGGVAIGLGIGSHDSRIGNGQFFRPGQTGGIEQPGGMGGGNGYGNGFGTHHPGDQSTGAPRNG